MRVRLHIRLGTVILPVRELNDDDVTDDVIDVELNDNEKVMEVTLEKQARYRQTVRAVEHPFDPGKTITRPRNDKITHEDTYRYRMVTVEYLEVADGEVEDTVIAGELVEDADVVG